MHFGKTLNEVVKTEWKCHALSYVELKRAISEQNGAAADGRREDEDGHSVHTESSYAVSDAQKAKFFNIFDDSVERLRNFYDAKALWATQEFNELQLKIEMVETEERQESQHLSSPSPSGNGENQEEKNEITEEIEATSEVTSRGENEPLSVSSIVSSLGVFARELDLVLEFLDLNATGCSKIMKKYDKRTKSCLREQKLNELKAEYSFLYDGGEIKRIKSAISNWLSTLDSNLGSAMTSATISSSVRANSKSSIENPQCSEATQSHTAARYSRRGSRGYLDFRRSKLISTDFVHATKDTIIMRKIIDTVDEELFLQRLNSPFFDNHAVEHPLPCFSDKEVEIDNLLGHGEFCKIYEVTKFNVPESCHICFLHRGYDDSVHVGSGSPLATTSQKTNPNFVSRFSLNRDLDISNYEELEDDHEDEYDYETRGFMKDHCLRNGVSRYAIKRVRGSLSGEDVITDASSDLAREAQFLAALSHPNIIKIRGTINIPGHPDFSLILDRLYDTLEVRMEKWKVEVKKYKGKLLGFIGKNKDALRDIWEKRLLAAYDLANGLEYLHKCGIIHRDIKPANIGFDIRGDIKLFDFGLAKELKPSERVGEDQYRTSGIAGTRRYMAPEVAKVVPYGFKADVYSFGIMFWEMLTLKTAFYKYSRERHYQDVIIEGKRPKILRSWGFVFGNLLCSCWDPVPSQRASFQAVCQLMKLGMPLNCLGSDRSEELLLRSLRSTHGERDTETETGRNTLVDLHSDPLSKSTRTSRRRPKIQ